MEDDFFLTQEKKKYYREDFEKVLLYKNDENHFWEIKKGITETCKKININPHLQTLYSNHPEARCRQFGNKQNVYLQIAYSESYKEKFSAVLREIKGTVELQGEDDFCETVVKIEHREPHEARQIKIDIGCCNNPSYFKIYSYWIELQTFDIEKHKLFLDLIEKRLPTL